MKPKVKTNHCKLCKKEYDNKEINRIYGKDSMVSLLNYCSAKCYTQAEQTKKQVYTNEKTLIIVVNNGIIESTDLPLSLQIGQPITKKELNKKGFTLHHYIGTLCLLLFFCLYSCKQNITIVREKYNTFYTINKRNDTLCSTIPGFIVNNLETVKKIKFCFENDYPKNKYIINYKGF
ncbi:MAG: hypothetical protein WC390_07430 [Sulfurimonas sp.]|jgi:hypothetical protein